MSVYRNLGVYSEEISGFSPAVEEVDTALPAFIGYTAKAKRKEEKDLHQVPVRISSMREYENLFGFPFESDIEISVDLTESNRFVVTGYRESPLLYLLYYSVRIYFDNGGGPCYILSVDSYQNPQQVTLRRNPVSGRSGLLDGLNRLALLTDISLIVIPEAVKLPAGDYSFLVQSALLQCSTLGNRFAIFDLYNGDSDCPDLNRNKSLFGSYFLNCGSAYYPFVRTKMNSYLGNEGSNVSVIYSGESFNLLQVKKCNFPLYKFVKRELNYRFINLPSCGAVAGAYVATDKSKGVWKSPANFSLSGVLEPVVNIDSFSADSIDAEAETGKAINSIRSVSGKGTFVLGAKTLAFSEEEESYVPVSRFLIMVKESLRKSTGWVAFEPNDTFTWNKVRLMIENYLTGKWQDGALAGMNVQGAFYVKCGLGSTMTDQDLENGRIIIEVGLAMLRPAEFTVFTITHLLRVPSVVLAAV